MAITVDIDLGTGPDAGRVYERGLLSAADDREFTSGKLLLNTDEGIDIITIAGQSFTLATLLPGQQISTAAGVLTIDKVEIGFESLSCIIDFTYELTAPQNHDKSTGNDLELSDLIDVSVTDYDNVVGTGVLNITIMDDVPSVTDVAETQVTENAPVVIDIRGSIDPGADGVDLATGVTYSNLSGNGTLVYHGDGTFTYTPGPGRHRR